MQELKIIGESQDNIVISWNKSDIADEYVIEGLTNNFSFISLGRTNSCTYICNKNKDLLGYRVAYVLNNDENKYKQDCIVDITNVINLGETKISPINIITVKAPYNQVSMSFRSEEHFDLYRLYNEKGEILTETEDCIILGQYGIENYYVEGYNKSSDRYILAGISEITHCEPTINSISVYTPIISIVIPVYNCETFLPRTVQSILSSTFTDFEILLIDDCSNKNTYELCNWYESNFDCIKVVHKENRERTSAARNTGTKIAKGEWLSFVDSDDIVHPYMYEKLYKAAMEYNSNIAISQCILREDYNNSKRVLAPNVNENIIVMNSFKEIIENKVSQRNIYFVAVWNKIVKTEFARKVKFNEQLHIYEDEAYTQSLYSYIDKFILVKEAYYIWDKRKQKTEGTLSNTYNDKPKDLIWVDYVLSCAGAIFDGNPDEEIANVYKYDFLKNILNRYSTLEAKNIKNIIAGLLKYLVRKFNLPVDDLQSKYNKQELYKIWQEIKNSNLREYDGIGPVPLEYKE